MKKSKLLTSILSLALVLTLGACQQDEDETLKEEETSEETSEQELDTEDTTQERDKIEVEESSDVEVALSLLEELGVDTSSWAGINYHDYEQNYETGKDGVTFYSVKDETTYQASELDSKLTGLYENIETRTSDDYTYSYTERQYYDGSTLYSNNFGLTTSQERDLSLSYFTSSPIYYITYYLEYVASLSGQSQLFIEDGYEFTGSISKEEDSYTIYISISGEYEDYYWLYGTYYGQESLTLKVVYDLYGGLLDFDLEQYGEETYPEYDPDVTYIFKESTTCSNYTESVETPDWLKGE
ncbi:MAG: hypothetical protein LUD22_00080 [Coprobacillus sp.]|nr:hypothetical protein [Coprobacillus sp.]